MGAGARGYSSEGNQTLLGSIKWRWGSIWMCLFFFSFFLFLLVLLVLHVLLVLLLLALLVLLVLLLLLLLLLLLRLRLLLTDLRSLGIKLSNSLDIFL